MAIEKYGNLSAIPAAQRQTLHEALQKHRGAITEIARRCKPPRNRATITLWLQGRVQSAALDAQIPRLVATYLAEQGG